MMTRNDFELLANALKSEQALIKLSYTDEDSFSLQARLTGFSFAVNCVAGVCKANNARFDPKRFKIACGVA